MELWYCDVAVCEQFYCPAKSPSPLSVGSGYYPIGPIGFRNDRALCPSGYYCINGVQQPCAPGFFSSSSGNSNPTCSGECPAGSYCPGGTTSPIACGNASVYCPSHSSGPIAVSVGYYSIGTSPSSMSGQAVCPKGSYCVGGVLTPCANGTFRDSTGGSSPGACVVCPAGSFCPAGAASATACGVDAYYCPAGSSSPTAVGAGYYALGSVGSRSDRAVCPVGSYCPGNGSSLLCPSGRFGNSSKTHVVNVVVAVVAVIAFFVAGARCEELFGFLRYRRRWFVINHVLRSVWRRSCVQRRLSQ